MGDGKEANKEREGEKGRVKGERRNVEGEASSSAFCTYSLVLFFLSFSHPFEFTCHSPMMRAFQSSHDDACVFRIIADGFLGGGVGDVPLLTR